MRLFRTWHPTPSFPRSTWPFLDDESRHADNDDEHSNLFSSQQNDLCSGRFEWKVLSNNLSIKKQGDGRKIWSKTTTSLEMEE